MNIVVDYQSRIPIYEQIVDNIIKYVALDILKPKQKIATIRELALNLGINPNTVKKAYDILEQKGVIITKSTKGTFIVDDVLEVKKAKIAEIIEDINRAIGELENIGLKRQEIKKRLDF